MVARDLDAADIHTAAWVDIERHVGRLFLAIELRIRVHVRERIPQAAEVIRDRLGGGVCLCTGKHFACLQLHKLADLGIETEQVACELDAVHRVGLAFIQGDGDVDVLAIWRDRDLGRLGAVFEKAPIEVVRPHRFQVALEFFA